MSTPIRVPATPPDAELLAALESHRRWLESERQEGERLRLRDAVGVDLHGRSMRSADLNGANLVLADLRRADLRCADLRHADLGLADLEAAQLADADLRNAVLVGTQLIGADLSNANLDRAWAFATNFTRANLDRATLRGATLDPGKRDDAMSHYLTSLHGSVLREFRFPSVASITQSQLDAACGDDETALPDGFRIGRCGAEGPAPQAGP